MEAGGGQSALRPHCPVLEFPLLPQAPSLTFMLAPQCHLSGCMMDLFIQMAIIMGLKQTLSNCIEYLYP